MVGSELPSPETRESTGHRPRGAAGRAGCALDADRRRAPCSTTSTSSCARARCSASPGVEGNGQTELVETIMGMRRARGQVTIGDCATARDITSAGTLARREAGIGYIPEDRTRHGLLATQPLWVNRILGYQTRPPVARRGSSA